MEKKRVFFTGIRRHEFIRKMVNDQEIEYRCHICGRREGTQEATIEDGEELVSCKIDLKIRKVETEDICFEILLCLPCYLLVGYYNDLAMKKEKGHFDSTISEIKNLPTYRKKRETTNRRKK